MNDVNDAISREQAIETNQGWEITEIKFNDCCPSSYIDKLDVIFEKQKKGE